MEALSCQRPVVAPQVGSIHETVIDGQNGYLIPTGSVETAAHRWLQILIDKQLAKRMGEHGRLLVTKNCSLQSMTDGYSELIETIHRRKTGQLRTANPLNLFPKKSFNAPTAHSLT
jgi:glycosyltransferase involved in cell wall biosynthesis